MQTKISLLSSSQTLTHVHTNRQYIDIQTVQKNLKKEREIVANFQMNQQLDV